MASPVTLQDLLNTKSAAVIKAELISLLQLNGFDGTDWNSGSISRTLLEIESASLEQLWLVVTEIAKGMHLDTAVGGWLTLLAQSHYGLERTPAEYTRGIATFSLIPGLGPRTINAGEIIVSDGLGHNFITDNPTPVTLTSLTPSAAIPIIAQQTGSDYNVGSDTITIINQGPPDITVTNQGIPLVASILTTPPALPIITNTFTLLFSELVDGVTNGKTLTFTQNFTTLADLVFYLNTDPTFNPNLVATQVGSSLQIATKKTGVNNGFVFTSSGTANFALGLSIVSNTTALGGTSVDGPAFITGAYLAGPFNVSGLKLEGSVVQNAIADPPFTFIFPSNYATMDALVAAIGETIPGLRATNDGGRLKLSTIRTGPAQFINLFKTGTANAILGFSTLFDQVAVGTSAWITQEGRDLESDTSLISRCKAEWGIIGTGTYDAFVFWARSADPKVQKVAVYSHYLNGTPKAGAVTLYIAGVNSALDSTTVLNVYNYILARMPIMSELYVGTVTIKEVVFTGTIKLPARLNLTKVKNEIITNVTLYSQSLDIAETVYPSRIIGAIYRTPEPLNDVQITAPASAITVAKNELALIKEDPINPLKFVIV